ncbi:MAG: sigma 54-dependent Fis family transcriptional regulator [Deltaproteobacteria bacterium]|nr:sigma 54-dependent Fis family transcriptional regulator [Deltaproteobacteria bacterium]
MARARPKPIDATKTLQRGDAQVQRPLGAIVRVLGARSTPPEHRLRDGTCIVGASPSCTIVIADPSVSREHVELGLVPEGVTVRDLKSRNGTFYLEQRVQQMTLTLGSRIRLGPVEVSIDPDTDDLYVAPELHEGSYRGMVGSAPAMRRLFGVMSRLEGSLVTVLVTGESGTGKELVARALHEGSSVAAGPFVTVNCGAIPRELVSSELFGHKRGAFTGALEARRGAFESADGGTLFLDEIGELPLDVQPALLRALESGEIRPVGADRSLIVRARVVAATNRDLRAEVAAGRFREDLFYRLAVVELGVPALRERLEDVERIANGFASAAGAPALPAAVVANLRSRRWPGNVRELRNVVQAFVALGVLPREGPPAAADGGLSAFVDATRPYADLKDELLDRFTRLYLEELMKQTGGNQSAAARVSGLDRSWLWRLLVKYGMTKG